MIKRGTVMLFNLNEFLMAVSYALDFVEMDILGVVTNHSKRVAYISMRLAEEMKLSKEEIFDVISLAMLHDNGACERNLHDSLICSDREYLQSLEGKQEHGLRGEENIRNYPFLTNVENVIKYHHENYDGSGFFGKKGNEIPIMAQIIKLADSVELNTNLKEMYIEDKKKVQSSVKEHENNMFSPVVVSAFLKICQTPYFWLDLKDEFINTSIRRNMPNFTMEMPLSRIHDITKVFSKIIDAKSRFTKEHSSQLTEKVKIMAKFYKKPEDEIYKLMIAANLHDIGKLAISNSILDKPGKLDEREFDIMRQHSYYTRLCLQGIKGFEDITEWASNHHEKLNGKGYPLGKTAEELDFNSRLIGCLDVYQALLEERPYRTPIPHEQSIRILDEMANNGYLDKEIVEDIKFVFK